MFFALGILPKAHQRMFLALGILPKAPHRVFLALGVLPKAPYRVFLVLGILPKSMFNQHGGPSASIYYVEKHNNSFRQKFLNTRKLTIINYH